MRKHAMNNAALKYKLYTQLLEGNISNRQYDMLLELGFLDKVKAFLGGGMEVGADLGKLFKDKANQKLFATAKDNITKAVKDLKDVASKAGVDEGVVNEFLKGVLDGAGVDPAAVASAKPTGGEGGDKGESGGPKPGTAIDPGKPEQATPALVRSAAQAANIDPDKALADAEEKKVTPEKATEVLAKSISKQTGTDVKLTSQVIQALMKSGHLVAEGIFRPNAKDLLKAAKEVGASQERGKRIIERWQQLAGFGGRRGLLTEDDHNWKEEAEDLAKGLQQKTAMYDGFRENLAKALKINVDELEKQIGDIGLEGVIAKIGEKKPEAIEKAAKDAGVDLKNIGKSDEKAKEAAEEAKKKYGAALEDVKKAVGPEADEGSIAKILAALDDLDAIKIAA